MPARSILPLLCASVLLASCGFGPPPTADLLVSTAPPGAACLLAGPAGPITDIAPTPGIALIDPAAAGLTVTCRRGGFADASVAVPPYPSAITERRVDIALMPAP